MPFYLFWVYLKKKKMMHNISLNPGNNVDMKYIFMYSQRAWHLVILYIVSRLSFAPRLKLPVYRDQQLKLKSTKVNE